MADSVTLTPWPAPGKINRFLHITGRRDDGYHELQTLFQFIDLCDELHFAPRADGAVRLAGDLAGVQAGENLVVQAAELLRRHTGCRHGADITLRKRLPIGGGLGGGSSDAATTLHALNELWGLALDTGELQQLALRLGADVPVFVAGAAAFAEGVGERLQPAEVDEGCLVLIDPGVAVNTALMYADFALVRDCAPISFADLDLGRAENVFERVVFSHFAEIREAHAWLSSFADARLSGSGGCLFGRFASIDAASAVLRRLPARWRGWVTRTLNRSPLLDRRERTRD